MNEILQVQLDILASIDAKPCTLIELGDREFLKSKTSFGIEWSVSELEQKGYIKEVGKKLYSVKKKAKQVLIENGYYD